MDPVLQVTRRALAGWPDAERLATLSASFGASHVVRLPRFFDPALLTMIQRHLADAPFTTRVAHDVDPPAVDLKLRDERLHGALHFLLNDPAVVSAVRVVAAAPDIRGFVGAVYRLLPGVGHRDSWHTDADGNRLVGLSVNLSEVPFEGGELQLRTRPDARPLATIANTGAGDAVLFGIDPTLEHRIAPMRGTNAKTALAGWFCLDPSR